MDPLKVIGVIAVLAIFVIVFLKRDSFKKNTGEFDDKDFDQ